MCSPSTSRLLLAVHGLWTPASHRRKSVEALAAETSAVDLAPAAPSRISCVSLDVLAGRPTGHGGCSNRPEEAQRPLVPARTNATICSLNFRGYVGLVLPVLDSFLRRD